MKNTIDIQRIDTSLLMSDTQREVLSNDGQVIMRKVAKEDDVIWKCIKYKYVEDLISNKLFFDEYSNLLLKDNPSESKLENYKFEQKVPELGTIQDNIFLSCWLNYQVPTEQHINLYGQDNGKHSCIVIGTTVSKLLKYLSYVQRDKTIYAGNVQYLPNIKYVRFSATQLIGPLFFKDQYYSYDNEFRLVYYDDSSNENKEKNILSVPDDYIFNYIDQIIFFDVDDNDRKNNIKKIEENGISLKYQALDSSKMKVYKVTGNKSNKLHDSTTFHIEKPTINTIQQSEQQKNSSLYSGQYDSMKQRSVLLRSNRFRNYLSYNATLRMEMLLGKKIILTDAEFIDGLYFAWMADDFRFSKEREQSELDSLLNFAKNSKALEIRCRKETEEILSGIFGKGFKLSSLEPAPLSMCLYRFMDKFQGEISIGDLDQFLKLMEEYFKKTLGACYEKEWGAFSRRFNRLVSEISSENPIREKWDVPWEMDRLLYEQYPGDDNKISYKDKILKSYKCAVEKAVGDKDTELYKVLSKHLEGNFSIIRSEMKDIFEEIERGQYKYISESGEYVNTQNSEVVRYRKECERLYNDRYNKAIAIQHHASLIDVCDNQEIINHLIKKHIIQERQIELKNNMIDALATMSWGCFKEIYNNVIQGQDNIFKMLDEKSTAGNDVFFEELEQYISRIENEVNKLNGNMDEEDRNEWKNGPWNYCNVDEYKEYRSNIRFVGNSSDLSEREGNEICIYRDKEIFRLRIMGKMGIEKDTDYDTMIARVDNPFNNGSLVP